MKKPWLRNLFYSWVYYSFLGRIIYKAYKWFLRYTSRNSELFRISDYCLKHQKSLNVGMIQSLVMSDDNTSILEWRDGLGRRTNPPKIDAFTILRIDQSLLFSTKLFSERRELESRYKRLDRGIQPILDKKGFNCDITKPSPHGVVLVAALLKIASVHELLHTLNARACVKYDSENTVHERKLRQLWDLMMPNEPLKSRISTQWTKIGFQGKDPATDFRGMGMLGLDNLSYLAKHYPATTERILDSSGHLSSGFSMAVVGINLTYLSLNLLRNRELYYHFYVQGVNVEAFHEFYCFLFDQFEQLWSSETGHTVLDFDRISKELMRRLRRHLLEGIDCVLINDGTDRGADQSVKTVSFKKNIDWEFLTHFHIDPKYGLLNARSALLIQECFNVLDWKGDGSLDDIQFTTFLTCVTSLDSTQALKIFDLFDLDGSGGVESEEFFLLMCILSAVKDNMGKTFMFQNWRTCFQILDADGSKDVSKNEFETLGFLFNFTPAAIRRIYAEFDISGKAELSYADFELFVLAAIELQATIDKNQAQEIQKPSTFLEKTINYFNEFWKT